MSNINCKRKREEYTNNNIDSISYNNNDNGYSNNKKIGQTIISYKYFSELNLDFTKYEDLSYLFNISKSLGIPYEDYTVQELNNKILDHLKIYEDLFNSRAPISGCNGGNGSGVDRSSSSDILSHEILFWKIWKSDIIKTKIFSNFIYSTILNYDRLNDCGQIIKFFSNAKYIIKDLVKCNKKLFKDYEVDMELVLGLVKKDKLFYDRIFSGEYYIGSKILNNSSIIRDKVKTSFYFLPAIIKEHNIAAFDSYLSNYSYSDRQVYNEINSNSTNGVYLELIKSCYQSYSGIKFINHLREKDYLSHSLYQLQDQIDEDSNDIFNKSLNFEHLIKFYKLIIDSLNNKNKNNNNSCKYIESISKLNHFIDHLNSNNNKDKLELKVVDILKSNKLSNYKINNDKIKDILKLFYKVIISVYKNNYNSIIKPRKYYYYFKSKSQILKKYGLNQVYQTIRSSSSVHNSYSHFEILFNITFKSEPDYQLELVSNCYDKSKRMNRTNNENIFRVVLESNDIDIIDYLIKLISPNEFFKTYNQAVRIEILQSIKYVNVLDFYFRYYKNYMFYQNSNNWRYIKNQDILNHYEMLMGELNLKFNATEIMVFCKGDLFYENFKFVLFNNCQSMGSKNSNNSRNNSPSKEISLPSPTIKSVYNIGDISKFDSKTLNYFLNIRKQDKILELFKSLLEFRSNTIIEYVPIDSNKYSKFNCKIINWIFKDYSNKDIVSKLNEYLKFKSKWVSFSVYGGFNLKNQLKFLFHPNDVLRYLSNSGRINDVCEILLNNHQFFRLFEIDQYFSYEVLSRYIDFLMNNLKYNCIRRNKSNKDFDFEDALYRVLLFSSRSNLLFSFKRVIRNNKLLLWMNYEDDRYSVFSNKEILTLIYESYQSKQVFNFLIYFMNIKKHDFKYLKRDF